ncbi:MAG: COG1361 S-layer family protein [Candidatus Micrarchaeota archaeon]
MKMNLVVAFALLLASFAIAQSVSNYLVVTDVKTSPAEIYAGDDVNMTFLLYNTYSYSADGVIVQLTGGYPLFELSPTQTYRMNSVPSGIHQLGLEPLTFKLHVDPNAAAGTYTLNVVATYATVTETKLANGATSTLATVKTDTMPISIRVRGAPHLSTSLVSQGVEPGVKSIVTLSIINDGTDTAKSAAIELSPTDVFEVLGTSSAYIGDIDAGKGAQASFTIRAKENAPNKKHELPVKLDYSNKYNKAFEYSGKVPIMVSVYEPSLEVSVSDTTARPRAGDDTTIVLLVRNKGDGLAKNVVLEVSSAGQIEVKWPTNKITIGDIAGGARATATVKVKVAEGASEQGAILPARLSYTSSNKQQMYDLPSAISVDLERSSNFIVAGSKSELRANELWKPVEFTLKNTGNTPAREIKVSMNTQYPITPSGRDQYIPSLAPGESATVTFHVDIDSKAVPQNYPVDIYFQWKEDGDKIYSETKSYSVGVMNGVQDMTMYYVVGGIVALAVGMTVYKKIKGKKK